jgi:hypothetical protein
MSTSSQTKWRIAAEEVSGCNCAWGCPCQFLALPTHGRCESLAAWEIKEGYFGGTRLDGVRFARIFWWPGPISDANGTRQLIIDEKATPEQREALIAIESGTQGGTFFEIFAVVCPNVIETVIAPMIFEADREKRQGRVSIQGIGELQTEPIKNPMTGDEHRARIVLPNGFHFKEAEVANVVAMRVQSAKPLIFEDKDTYAQLDAVEWSNV